ncbi:MAG: choice-of-anchor Q domain-containing protein [Verrucomicrobiota bacterium]
MHLSISHLRGFLAITLQGIILLGTIQFASSQTTHTVTTSADELDSPFSGPQLSLREAIRDAAPFGDTIVFDPTLSGQTIRLFGFPMSGGLVGTLDKSITIDASALTAPITISGNKSSRVFHIQASTFVTIIGVIIQDGISTDLQGGGGILNEGNLTLIDCKITKNKTIDNSIPGWGGGVHNRGTISFRRCTLTENSTGEGTEFSGGFGGALFNNGVAILTDCLITHNSTGHGASSDSSGEDGGRGGGIQSGGQDSESHSLSLARCTIAYNSTGDGGSGEFSQSGDGGHGGGLSFAGGTHSLVNCTIAYNSTGEGGTGFIHNGMHGNGGGVYNLGTTTSRHCSISKNTAQGNGGGIYSEGSFTTLTVENSILACNDAIAGDDLGLASSPNIFASGKNLIGDNDTVSTLFPAGLPNANGDYVGSPSAKLNPLLAPLANYGGFVQTKPPFSTSLAINNAATLTTSPGTDQRGVARPQNSTPDIGAIELLDLSDPFVDTDNDHMDDRLEPLYGYIVGTTDGHFDDDNDGSTNADELGNRTDPHDPNSQLRILSMRHAGTNPSTGNPLYDITWTCFPGLTYHVVADIQLNFPTSSRTTGPFSPGPSSVTHTELVELNKSNQNDFLSIRRN